MTFLEEKSIIETYDFDSETKLISKRAQELILKYPEKKSVFEGYVKNQVDECADLADCIMGVIWIL